MNPSDALSLSVGEFSGSYADGLELIVGTHAIIDYDGTTASITNKPPQARIEIFSINRIEENGAEVLGHSSLIFTSGEGFAAYAPAFEPSSSSISVGALAN